MRRRSDPQNLKSQELGCTSDISLSARMIAPSASAAGLSYGRTLLAVLSAIPWSVFAAFQNRAHYGRKRAGLVFAAFLLLSSGNAYAQDRVESDRAALVALYNATNGANWQNRTNWLSEEPLGEWYGVVTNESGRVRELGLEDNGLAGTLPPEIGNLSRLRTVVFWGNVLTGPVPRALWSLPLELVALTGNQVTGTLPSEVGDLNDLSFIDLGWTAMTGPLPASMTNLSLGFLRITGSYLCAPSNAAFQAWLETIGEFDGETCVPETGSVGTDRAALVALYNATNGANWRNNTNWLSARPLGEWYGVTTDHAGRIVELNLLFGGLTGPLPPQIGDLSHLRVLNLADNFALAGPLPPEVGNLRRLGALGLTSTDLKGPLPSSVGNLSELVYLGLSWSKMRGPLPQNLTNLSELYSFNTWETFLCAPANAAFQTWLGGLSDTHGVHTCEPAAIAVAPVELRLRGAVAQSITVTQTAGSDPVMWTAVGTQPWLRVTPAAGIGTEPVTVSVDPVMLQAVDTSAAGAVVVTADGVSVRVPVTVVREAAAAGLSLRAMEPRVRLGLVPRAGTGPPTVRRVPERTERRARRLAGGLPDSASPRSRPRQAADETTAGDRAALTTLYDATGGDDWWRNTHWLSERPLGDWHGVTTDSDGRVTALELSDNRLTGPVPETLGNLTRLASLDLGRNGLTGSIPAVLGELAGLERLYLNFNGLTGAIPATLGNLSNLESLNLQWNEFGTPIPPELGNLTRLRELNLEYALVTGPIPPTLGNLTNLKYLYLQDNYALTGPIPAELGNLTNLEWLSLGGNRLEGSIPAALGRLTNLRELRLQANSLSGSIPPEFGNLSKLGLISLHNNSLTGAIPPDLGRLSDLFYLGLHENALTGPIPASLGNTSLYWLFLYGNELTGGIPAELGEIENLRFLYLQDNALDGSIPSALGELDNLKVLDLRNNVLTGPIPATLGQLSSLEVLDLSDNELTGPIPRDLGALSTLWWLDLRDNALAGPIPSELGVLSELVWLDLAGNGLSGPIPSELGALERLTKLSLWRNDLTGSIPGRLGTLPNLEQLYLGENKLTGPIPAELGGLTNLRQLYLAGNALTGPIPAALGDLTNLEALHLRNNELTGEIPPEIENLTRLQVFNIRNTGLCVMPGSELHTWLATITFHGAVCATNGGPVAAQTKDDFEYWDLNGNSDLTCAEASGKDEGLKLPAYRDNRDGTGLIYEWLQRQRSSDTDNDGIACDSTSNPNGYVPRAGSTTPPPTNARECPAGSPTWMDLPVCEEGARVSYDRDAFGSAYSSLEDEIIDALPKSDGQVYTPYTCTLFDIQADGTAATDIEHIVALAEAYDSGLAESQFRIFAGDIDNLTIADPTVNRRQKSDLDAGEWEPPENRGWFAARVVAVKQEYSLSVNPAERDALQAMLNSDPSRTVSCGDGLTSGGPTYYFPHLAVGASWQTTITYINYSPEEVTCQTDFLSDYGSPLMVSFAGLGMVVSRTDVLPPGGSVHQETNVDLSASLAPGWARATCSGPVKASLLFRRHNSEGVPTAEAAVNAAAVPATRFVTFAEQGEGQFGTGVAYANPSATAAHVTFTARDAAGQMLASVDRTQLSGGHDAYGMGSLFGLTSFTGSIEVTSTVPIVSLSLNFEADPVFSSLPPGVMLAPADEAAFNDLFVGKRAATNFPGAYVDFVSPGRFSETRVVVTWTGSYTYRNTGFEYRNVDVQLR